ncbi:MAG: hypothetical protein AABY13_03165, partial [Nanoarchaeota archaeon]
TMRDIRFSDPQVLVDIDDDGVFAACAETTCQEVSFNTTGTNTFIFNVGHFTNYSASPSTGSCGVVTEDTVLSQNVNSSSDCFTIGAHNIELDCANFRINYSQGSKGSAVVLNGFDNVTIKRCTVVNVPRTDAHGINLTNTNNSFVLASTLVVDGDGAVGIFVERAFNNTLTNNTINTTGTGNNKHGVLFRNQSAFNIVQDNAIRTNGSGVNNTGIMLIYDVNFTIVRNNTIVTSGIDHNYGISVGLNANNNSVIGNRITTGGDFTNSGVFLDQCSGALIANNTIKASGSGQYNGALHLFNVILYPWIVGNNLVSNGTAYNSVVIGSNARGMVFENNDVVAEGSGVHNIGLQVNGAGIYGEYDNVIRNNSFSTRGSSLSHAIELNFMRLSLGVIQNHFIDNNLTPTGTQSYGVWVDGSWSVEFNNTIISNAPQWINGSSGVYNNLFSNTTFVSPNSSVRFTFFNVTNTSDVTRAKLNLSFNSAYLNSTNLSFMNTSAQVT